MIKQIPETVRFMLMASLIHVQRKTVVRRQSSKHVANNLSVAISQIRTYRGFHIALAGKEGVTRMMYDEEGIEKCTVFQQFLCAHELWCPVSKRNVCNQVHFVVLRQISDFNGDPRHLDIAFMTLISRMRHRHIISSNCNGNPRHLNILYLRVRKYCTC